MRIAIVSDLQLWRSDAGLLAPAGDLVELAALSKLCDRLTLVGLAAAGEPPAHAAPVGGIAEPTPSPSPAAARFAPSARQSAGRRPCCERSRALTWCSSGCRQLAAAVWPWLARAAAAGGLGSLGRPVGPAARRASQLQASAVGGLLDAARQPHQRGGADGAECASAASAESDAHRGRARRRGARHARQGADLAVAPVVLGAADG